MKTKQNSKNIFRFAYRAALVLFVLLILAALAPQSVSAAKCKFKYKVQSGDTLISVADLFQADWAEIAEASELAEPYVLQLDQVLCIPDGVAPDNISPATTVSTSPSGTAALTAEANFFHVAVIAENFPKNHVYYVRVANPPENLNLPLGRAQIFTKIGRLKTDKNGNYSGYFPLPKYFPLTPQITLCLKDPFTDATYCTDYENQYHVFDGVPSYLCLKTGR